MWKMIIGQAIFQLVATLILHFAGAHILDYTTEDEIAQLKTLVFNTFVWMQIFNEFKYVFTFLLPLLLLPSIEGMYVSMYTNMMGL